MNELIDMHFHLDYYRNNDEQYKYINENQIYTLCRTNMPELYEANIRKFRETKYIKFGVGYNPQLVKSEKFDKVKFKKALNTTKYIGEVGLHYSKDYKNYKKTQKEIFNCICSLVNEHKILSVHSRNAHEDVLKVLIKYKALF